MLELYILVIGVITTLILLYYFNGYADVKIETFANHYLAACPSGFKMYYDSDGNTICYDETLNIPKHLLKYQKNGGQCILNGASTKDIPNCVDFILENYKNKSIEFCSTTFPSYFEDNATKSKGCTKGELNDLLSGPRSTSQPQCIIYPTEKENYNNVNSCFNQKELDDYPCFGNNCTKQIISWGKIPAVIAISFTTSSGMPRTAYTKKSIIRLLDVERPDWRNGDINLDKHLDIAEVAKAFYIDRTLSESDINLR